MGGEGRIDSYFDRNNPQDKSNSNSNAANCQQIFNSNENRFAQDVTKLVLGNTTANVHSDDPYNNRSKKFVPPLKANNTSVGRGNNKGKDEKEDEKYPGLDNKLVEMIEREILDSGGNVGWDDISGLEHAKKHINEIIVWPLMRPELFRGLRQPPRGLLLFGPPGTGKTMIGKAIASQLKYTFFSISASSLTSKWVGEGEKLVKTMFAIALIKQPSVIFIDEIDSLLWSRSDNENEASRRIKTEFLVQLDGARNQDEDKILLIGATNRPEELDEAARRRFIKRLYIPLPNRSARSSIVRNAIENDRKIGGAKYILNDENLEEVIDATKGYSAADMKNLMWETSLVPLREVNIMEAQADDLRAIVYDDFVVAIKNVKSSVDPDEVERYKVWNKKFGSFDVEEET